MLFQQTTANITTALIILVLGLIAGKILGNVLKNLFKDTSLDKVFDETVLKYVSILFISLIYIITLFFVLKQIGVTLRFAQSFGIIVILILLVLTFLSFKDSLPNLTAYLYVRRKFKIGQKLTYEDFEGKINSINFFETRIKTTKKEILAIPNIKLVLKRS